MNSLEAWLDEVADEPLPGAVSAAGVAAAIGAALIAKAARLALRQPAGEDRAQFEKLLDLAQTQRKVLLDLAGADVLAYQAVLDTRALPSHDSVRQQAWRGATEVPLRVAEACQALHDEASTLCDVCPPAVGGELEVGRWLLETGARAALLAAESNLRPQAGQAGEQTLRWRIAALRAREP